MTITNKYLRSLYPYAVNGHRKNCTCFICGIDRQTKFQIDHPYQAQRENTRLQVIEDKRLSNYDEQVHNSKLKMERVLSGNKYYKENDTVSYMTLRESVNYEECSTEVKNYLEQDTINCHACFQRIGSISFGCPSCGSYDYVYGNMLRNPMDRRWTLAKYSKYNKGEKSYAEAELIKRTKKLDDPENLI